MMYAGTATIDYVCKDTNKVVAWLDNGLREYYYSMIPKASYPNRQMYAAHITVVRSQPKEVVTEFVKNSHIWGKYQGEDVVFYYNGEIHFFPPYYYLDVWSDAIGCVRESLGLDRFRKGHDRYHITIGNIKGV